MKCIIYLIKHEGLQTIKSVNLKTPPKIEGDIETALSYYNFTIEQIHEDQSIEMIHNGDSKFIIVLF